VLILQTPLIYENGARWVWILTGLMRNEASNTTHHDGCDELGPGLDGSRSNKGDLENHNERGKRCHNR